MMTLSILYFGTYNQSLFPQSLTFYLIPIHQGSLVCWDVRVVSEASKAKANIVEVVGSKNRLVQRDTLGYKFWLHLISISCLIFIQMGMSKLEKDSHG